jgi:hypothetical protein
MWGRGRGGGGGKVRSLNADGVCWNGRSIGRFEKCGRGLGVEAEFLIEYRKVLDTG